MTDRGIIWRAYRRPVAYRVTIYKPHLGIFDFQLEINEPYLLVVVSNVD